MIFVFVYFKVGSNLKYSVTINKVIIMKSETADTGIIKIFTV